MKFDKAEKIEHVDRDAEVVPVQAPQDVWGDLDGEGPNYRGLGWIRSSVVMVKIQIGLGVLAIVSHLSSFELIMSLQTWWSLDLRQA